MKMGWENKFAELLVAVDPGLADTPISKICIIGPGARLIIEVKGEIQASGPFLFLFSPACLVTPGREKNCEAEN